MRAGALPLALLLAASGCRPGGRAGGSIDRDSIRFKVGTGGLQDRERWNRLVVQAAAARGVFEGELEVSGLLGTGGESPERYRARFDVSETVQAVEIPVRALNWTELVLTFRADSGGVAALKWELPWPSPASYRLLGIKDGHFAPGPLVERARGWLGLRTPSDPDGEVSVGSVPPRRLPVHFLGYDVADLVVIEGTTLAEADRPQVEALREWVRRGGTVAYVPGPSRLQGAPEPVLEMLGLAEPPGDKAGDAPAGGIALEVVPAQGARLLHQGLLLENPFGVGRAYLFTSAPPAPFSEDAIEAASAAWKRVLERSRSGFLAGSDPAGAPGGGPASAAVQALIALSGLRFPPREGVLLFVLGYLGVGFFLAGAVLRKKGKLEWMYLFALILAAASSVAIYRFGLLSAISEERVSEVTLAVLSPGSTSAQATSFVGVASPVRKRLKPLFPEGTGQAVPSQPVSGLLLSQVRGRPEEPLPLDFRVSAGSVAVEEVQLYANATRYLRFDYPVDLGGTVAAEVEGDWRLRVSNSTQHALDLTFVDQGNWFPAGSVGPRTEADLRLKSGGAPIPEGSEHEFPIYYYGPAPDEETCRGKIRDALFRCLRKGRYLIAGTGAPLFPGTGLGRVRKSMNFLVLELPDDR